MDFEALNVDVKMIRASKYSVNTFDGVRLMC